jgi:AraC family transcriptional regulator
MHPVAAALWFLESHFKDDVTLEVVAGIAGVSRFHLARAFRFATGYSVMGYLRGRRLSEAARRLASDTTDILGIALDCGYGSHEAFTRAFREQFGVTPQQVRRGAELDELELLEAIRMNRATTMKIDPARIVEQQALLIAGLSRTHRGTNAGMPAQWQEFTPYLGHIAAQANGCAYGVLYNDAAGSIDYLTGVEVTGFTNLPAEFAHVRIPAQRYAVFEHPGHISTIGDVWGAIWSDWFPRSGHEAADAPMFERYPETFDGRTGNGGCEIWIPLDH